MVASSPFLCPSRLRRSLARSRETRFTRPNRRACSQARSPFVEQQMFTDNEQCVIGVSSIGVFFCTAREIMVAIVSRDGLILV